MEKRKVLIILLSIVLIGLVAIAVALFGTKKPEQQKNTISQREITEWSTYTDSKYGYSIKYPNTWYLKKETTDGRDFVSIESTKKPLYGGGGAGPRDSDAVAFKGYSIAISAQQNTEKLSLEEYIASVVGRGNDFTSQKVTINGLEAIEAHEKDAIILSLPHYFLQKDNYIYEIGCNDEYSGLQDIAEQIVQSFSFTK